MLLENSYAFTHTGSRVCVSCKTARMISSAPLNEKFDTHVRHFEVRVAVRRSVSAHTPETQRSLSQSLYEVRGLQVADRYRKELQPALGNAAICVVSFVSRELRTRSVDLFNCGYVIVRDCNSFALANQRIHHQDEGAKQIGGLITIVRGHVDIMESIGETVGQREKEARIMEDKKKEVDDVEEKKKEKQPKKNFKYYFNRLKYYHYYVADKVDKFIAFVCMWVIRIQLYLIDISVNGLPSTGEIGESSLDFENDAN